MLRAILAGLCTLSVAAPAAAEDPTPPVLSIELNSAENLDTGCRLTFVAMNGLQADLAAVVFETVFFGRDGAVARMTLLDFRDLPQNRMRVRQFDLPGQQCPALGRILLNAASRCEGNGIDPGACMDALKLTTRLDVEVAG